MEKIGKQKHFIVAQNPTCLLPQISLIAGLSVSQFAFHKTNHS